MWSQNTHLPTNSAPENARPVKRQHSARYYAHRVKESLTTRIWKLICAIFLALIFLVGLTTFILWLSLRPHRPRFHIHEFSIPALMAEKGGNQNYAQIIYNATARNANENIGIYYDSMQLNVYYQQQSIGGAELLPPFYQKPKNTTVAAGRLHDGTLNVTGHQWQRFRADAARGEVAFRFEVTSVIRFKISSWDSKRHVMHANCPVGIGPGGVILPVYKDKRCPVYFV